MPRNTKVSTDWLKSLDANGDCISEWCVAIANDPYSARGRVCSRTISVANMGLRQLQSHSEGKKHQDIMEARKKQAVFKTSAPAVSTSSMSDAGDGNSAANTSTVVNTITLAKPKGNQWVPATLQDKAWKAEALLVLKMASSNYSFASYDNIADVCRLAFEDSDIAQHITMNRKKLPILLLMGLARTFNGYFAMTYGPDLCPISLCISTRRQRDRLKSNWTFMWVLVRPIWQSSGCIPAFSVLGPCRCGTN